MKLYCSSAINQVAIVIDQDGTLVFAIEGESDDITQLLSDNIRDHWCAESVRFEDLPESFSSMNDSLNFTAIITADGQEFRNEYSINWVGVAKVSSGMKALFISAVNELKHIDPNSEWHEIAGECNGDYAKAVSKLANELKRLLDDGSDRVMHKAIYEYLNSKSNL